MSNLPAELDFVTNKSASPERMNLAMAALDLRLRTLESYKPNFDALLAQIQQVGLDRLNTALLPVYNELVSIANLGAIFVATSAPSVTVATGNVPFVIDASLAQQFAPAQWLVAMSADAGVVMAGHVVSYVRATGTLTINVSNAFGAGAHGNWTIFPTVPPLLTAQAIDGGTLDGQPGTVIQHKRTLLGTAPTALADGEFAIDEHGALLWWKDYQGNLHSLPLLAGLANTLATLDATGLVPLSQLPHGVANTLATLDSGGHLPLNQLPAALQGAMTYIGTWDASANNPALVSGAGTKGYLYRVNNAGTTPLDGITQWNVGDMAVFNGTVWNKWDGISNEVLSVAGRTGNVTLALADLLDSTAVGRALGSAASVAVQRVLLNIDQATMVNDANQAITNAMEAVVWTAITAPRTGTLPSAASMNQGQTVYIFDESGACSQNNTITLTANGADTINGASSYVLNYANASVALMRVSSTKWTVSSVGSAPTAPIGRNLLINGGFDSDQRYGGTLVSTPGYLCDMWNNSTSGAGVYSAQVVADAPPGLRNSLKTTVTTAVASPGATEVYQLFTAVEGVNIAKLKWGLASGRTVTLSFWVKASVAGTYGLCIGNGGGTQCYTATYVVTTANVWQYATIVIPGATAGTWASDTTAGLRLIFDLGSGSNSNGTAGAWATTTTYARRTAASVRLISTAGATHQVTGCQIELGSYATEFEYIPVDRLTLACMRYYWKGQCNIQGYATTSGRVKSSISHPPMRATPAGNWSMNSQGNVSSVGLELAANGSALWLIPSATGDAYYNATITLDASL
ncbi:hypothetical protein [Methylovirgula sp. 4M-Z18]|uniref:hypothetical protein n=1 Tax=Methylovirgula sp. 4M-Z18 TaxID=2293567 RepID=UPI000E2E826D|nr:hypothetical protein [Methylovirgula sp. 4M-Z18]RFB80396.1 hypothetical protein DYH55_02390 [Methylovirgula sp. 4M-Z18]